ncbi:hypothetical protein O988_04498 [Pseudogymnoascus sp. VKM F-3808]|nr:hypothetical protein O988_04498 [Pseudogymnoascus sp. VKM F-3808]
MATTNGTAGNAPAASPQPPTETTASTASNPTKLHGRAFYESLGSPKFVLAPMVDTPGQWRQPTAPPAMRRRHHHNHPPKPPPPQPPTRQNSTAEPSTRVSAVPNLSSPPWLTNPNSPGACSPAPT